MNVYIENENRIKTKKIALHTIGDDKNYASAYHKNSKNNECSLTKQEELSSLDLFLASIVVLLCSLQSKILVNLLRENILERNKDSMNHCTNNIYQSL
jgi:hypothetical protein